MDKKEYQVKKIDVETSPLPYAWEKVSGANIDCFLWETNDYKPRTNVKLFYTDTHIHIFFKSYENRIKIKHFNMDDDVYKDSCVEFFIKPNPVKDSRYLNFEMNAIGILLLGLGTDRHDRKRIKLENPSETFGILTSVTRNTIESYNSGSSLKHQFKNKHIDSSLESTLSSSCKASENETNPFNNKFWTVEYSIPFVFIEKYFGKLDFSPGCRLEGNFYKCGDETRYPHYGCWNPIKRTTPDFHRPEFFGDLILGVEL